MRFADSGAGSCCRPGAGLEVFLRRRGQDPRHPLLLQRRQKEAAERSS